MAGKGPAPKDPSQRARRNKTPGTTVITIDAAKQPTLVRAIGKVNPATGEPWSKFTLTFWKQLGAFPTLQNIVDAQWSMLALSMMLLDKWVATGDDYTAKELRLQLAKFGIAPDDIARLRYSFAIAETAENRTARERAVSSEQRYAALAPRTQNGVIAAAEGDDLIVVD